VVRITPWRSHLTSAIAPHPSDRTTHHTVAFAPHLSDRTTHHTSAIAPSTSFRASEAPPRNLIAATTTLSY